MKYLGLVFFAAIFVQAALSADFTIALKQNAKGIAHLERIVLDEISNIESPNYGKFLTLKQIDKLVATPIEHVIKVKEWISLYPTVQCDFHSDHAKCSGDAVEIMQMLQIDPYPMKYQIPEYLTDSIDFVDGLFKRRPTTKPSISKAQSVSVDPGMVTREVITRLYQIKPSTSANASVAAIEYQQNQGFSNANLVFDQVANGVGKNPIRPDHIIGVNTGVDDESQLDVQTMYWAAADAELWFEVVDDWMYSWAVDFVKRSVVPEVVSISWGWSETNQCYIAGCADAKKYVERCNNEFLKIVSMGTTIVVASGDAGSPGRTNEGCESTHNKNGWTNINPVFPGCSPWVLSVGATFVLNNTDNYDYQSPVCKKYHCATGTTEQETSFNQTGWTSGAGFSHWTQTPSWQKSEVEAYLRSAVQLPDSKFYNRNGRAYPDVSAVGHNCFIYSAGSWENVDGTSCSSPIFAGIIANLNSFQKSRSKPRLGFANPLLYRMYRHDESTFHDIEIGNSSCTEMECCDHNFGFVAGKGWDVVSGLGTANVESMKRYLAKF